MSTENDRRGEQLTWVSIVIAIVTIILFIGLY